MFLTACKAKLEPSDRLPLYGFTSCQASGIVWQPPTVAWLPGRLNMATLLPNRLLVCLAACSYYHFVPTALKASVSKNAAPQGQFRIYFFFVLFSEAPAKNAFGRASPEKQASARKLLMSQRHLRRKSLCAFFKFIFYLFFPRTAI